MTNKSTYQRLLVWLPVFMLAACADPAEQADVAADVANESFDNWPMHGFDSNEQRHSPLTQITRENISELSLAWYVELPDQRGQEATPLVIDGVMYTTAAWSVVYALDAATGEVLWRFDPEVDRGWAVNACCDVVNRGVAWWDGTLVFGTLDGRLIALDAADGSERWSVQTTDTNERYSITGAPRVANGLAYIGNGGAEFGVRGYMSAYDIATGELAWRFYTVPGNPADGFENEAMEMAAETWFGEWWALGGGGTVWDSMVHDPELNLLYIGTGNSSPWDPLKRSEGRGDNLFLSSIVALNADTGEYVWHYQTTPGDAWDYTATQHIMLADLEIGGTERKVLMQAPKNGFFYVIDRETGELISAEAIVPVSWADGVDIATGRPNVTDEAKYWETGQPALLTPAFLGAHNWHPMSFNPQTGHVYIPAQELSFPYASAAELEPMQLAANLGIDTGVARLPDDPAVIEAVKEMTRGHLAAWDPVTQSEAWRVQYPGPWNGGVLSTASNLVFQGTAAGFLNAYDAADGEKLWEFSTQTGIVAPPMTYSVNGEQYLTVMAGWGGIFPLIIGPIASASGETVNRSRILTFRLGGSETLPPVTDLPREFPDFSAIDIDPDQVETGFAVFDRFCGHCHGAGAVGGGVITDLRYSAFLGDADAWATVVIEGSHENLGMVGFGEEISNDQAQAVRHYVLDRQRFAIRTAAP